MERRTGLRGIAGRQAPGFRLPTAASAQSGATGGGPVAVAAGTNQSTLGFAGGVKQLAKIAHFGKLFAAAAATVNSL